MSGSMKEMGKILLLKNLLKYVAELINLNYSKFPVNECKFYNWSSSLSEIKIQSKEDLMAIKPSGSADLERLKGMFEDILVSNDQHKILLLSDGCFSGIGVNQLSSWINEQSGLMIRTVCIGTDANELKLKKLSTNDSTYKAENINSAINSLLFGDDSKRTQTCPETIQFITDQMQTDASGEWDA